MKASSEEMQSTNEELRSTMEELETSKEELQSINEELQTVNQQNRHKVEELAQLSGDLQNLLSATDIATLFLDRELRILRFTPKLGDLFNVRVTDRGRPISDLTHRLGYRDLRHDAESVLGQSGTGGARSSGRCRPLVSDARAALPQRRRPYRRYRHYLYRYRHTQTHRRCAPQKRGRLKLMVNVEGVGVLIFDESGTLIDCNDTWLTMSGYTSEEVVPVS